MMRRDVDRIVAAVEYTLGAWVGSMAALYGHTSPGAVAGWAAVGGLLGIGLGWAIDRAFEKRNER